MNKHPRINQHPHSKNLLAILFWVGPSLLINMCDTRPIKQHHAQKSYIVFLVVSGEKVIWFWCFWPHGSGAEIEEIQGIESPNFWEIPKFLIEQKCIFLITFLLKKLILRSS